MPKRGRRGRLTAQIPSILSFLLELAGIAAIIWGCTLISPILGLIIGGFCLILFGLAVDPPKSGLRLRLQKKPEVQ